jgi:hypothetical protein
VRAGAPLNVRDTRRDHLLRQVWRGDGLSGKLRVGMAGRVGDVDGLDGEGGARVLGEHGHDGVEHLRKGRWEGREA